MKEIPLDAQILKMLKAECTGLDDIESRELTNIAKTLKSRYQNAIDNLQFDDSYTDLQPDEKREYKTKLITEKIRSLVKECTKGTFKKKTDLDKLSKMTEKLQKTVKSKSSGEKITNEGFDAFDTPGSVRAEATEQDSLNLNKQGQVAPPKPPRPNKGLATMNVGNNYQTLPIQGEQKPIYAKAELRKPLPPQRPANKAAAVLQGRTNPNNGKGNGERSF